MGFAPPRGRVKIALQQITRGDGDNCRSLTQKDAISVTRGILRRPAVEPGHRLVGSAARPRHSPLARAGPADRSQRQFRTDVRGRGRRSDLCRPLLPQAFRLAARTIRRHRESPASHPQQLLRRLRIPAGRNHDRERHLSHRPDGLGARPDARGIRCCAPGRQRCAAALTHDPAGNLARAAEARYCARRHPADQRDRPERDRRAADRLRRFVRAATRGPAEHGTRPAQLSALRSPWPAFRRQPRFVCVLAARSHAPRTLPSTRTLGTIRQRCGRVHPAGCGYR